MQKIKKLTIDDIARVLGVPKNAVSQAIYGKGRIRTATRDRVLACIQQTNFKVRASSVFRLWMIISAGTCCPSFCRRDCGFPMREGV